MEFIRFITDYNKNIYDNPDSFADYTKQIYGLSDTYSLSFMPPGLLSSTAISQNSLQLKINKKIKYKPWGFKNEFLKIYDQIIPKITFAYKNKILANQITKCPICGQEENPSQIYIFFLDNNGSICFGSLIKHLISVHDFKPSRYFIEYIYMCFVYAIYGSNYRYMKFDEITLQYFKMLAKLGNQRNFKFLNDKYNVEYFGNITTFCSPDTTPNYILSNSSGKLTNLLSINKKGIKELQIYFKDTYIKNRDKKIITMEETDENYDKSLINYVFYVHPFDSPSSRSEEVRRNGLANDIPNIEDYRMFFNLSNKYPRLFGLMLFANEGLYIISKLDIKNNIINLDQFKHNEYNLIYYKIKEKFLQFIETNQEIQNPLIYKDPADKDIMPNINLEDYKLSPEGKLIIQYYKFYENNYFWIDDINGIINQHNLKVSYYPKVFIPHKIDIDRGNLMSDKTDWMYDTLYVPINICP